MAAVGSNLTLQHRLPDSKVADYECNLNATEFGFLQFLQCKNNDFCCLTSTEAKRPIRDEDEWENGDRRVKPRNRRQPRRPRLPWTAARTTEVSGVRHCAATTAPRDCCPNCYAEQSHRDNVRSSAVGKQLRQKSNSHFPALDLFWVCVFVRVQLTSLLFISPGLFSSFCSKHGA